MRFLRYVDLLDNSDPKKEHGKRFIKMIFNIDKFKAYQNQSLQILENESQIYDEHDPGLDEEPSSRMQTKFTNINGHLNRA